jgi:hypothetical protein
MADLVNALWTRSPRCLRINPRLRAQDRRRYSVVNSVEPPREDLSSSRVPKSAFVLMLVIILAMASLSIYANTQRSRRSQVETVIVTPATSPSSTTP